VATKYFLDPEISCVKLNLKSITFLNNQKLQIEPDLEFFIHSSIMQSTLHYMTVRNMSPKKILPKKLKNGDTDNTDLTDFTQI
jgi:hypothetical protein